MRRIGGYGAALAMTPYFVIKVFWTFGLLLPRAEMAEHDWRAINAVTAVFAAAGILLALGITRRRAERVPAWLILIPAWVGMGFLVPIVLVSPILAPAAVSTDRADGATFTWVLEQALVIISFVGMGVGLTIASVAYARARWPQALLGSAGPAGQAEPVSQTRPLQITLARLTVLGCVILGLPKVFWAAGGTLGLDPGHLGDRDLWWYVLTMSTGLWLLAGAWGIWALTHRRLHVRFWIPMLLTWVSSGTSFAYGMPLLASVNADDTRPEHRVVYAMQTQSGAMLGLIMGLTALLVLHDRGRTGTSPDHSIEGS